MRLLFASCPLYGHVNTLLPLARAARQQGHDVAFATGADFGAHIERQGLAAWAVGPTHAQAGGNRQDSWLAYFAATAQQRAADLLARAVPWQPDAVIHEMTELGGAVTASATGAVHFVHGLGLLPRSTVWPALLEGVERLGRHVGVPQVSLADATYIDACPGSLQPGAASPWARVLHVRPALASPAAGDELPAWLDQLPHPRTIHLTLGTVFNGNVDVLHKAIGALASLDANLVVTVGADGDPCLFGDQPPHVRIERYLPHALLLPRCSAVVSQGGAGILLGAFGHGLPQLLLPQGADQFQNAEAAAASGAALALQGEGVTADAIASCALRLLEGDGFRTAARRLQAEIAAMPTLEDLLRAIAQRVAAG